MLSRIVVLRALRWCPCHLSCCKWACSLSLYPKKTFCLGKPLSQMGQRRLPGGLCIKGAVARRPGPPSCPRCVPADEGSVTHSPAVATPPGLMAAQCPLSPQAAQPSLMLVNRKKGVCGSIFELDQELGFMSFRNQTPGFAFFCGTGSLDFWLVTSSRIPVARGRGLADLESECSCCSSAPERQTLPLGFPLGRCLVWTQSSSPCGHVSSAPFVPPSFLGVISLKPQSSSMR